MSNRAVAWAQRQTTGSVSAKSVLLLLADYADSNDSCWPSQEHIAEICEMSVRTARECVKRLEEIGLVIRRREGDGDGRSNRLLRYHLQIPAHLKLISKIGRAARDAANSAGTQEPTGDAADAAGTPDENRQLTTRVPANERNEYRQILPGIHQGNPSGSEEREKRDPRLAAILAKHPRPDHDDLFAIEDEFAALSESDKAAAAERFDAWLERAGAKRRNLLGPLKYIAQRLWQLIPDETAAKPKAVAVEGVLPLELYSRPWWFAFWRRFDAGDRRALSSMLSFADQTLGSIARDPLKAAIENGADAALVRLSVSGDRDAVEAWRSHCWEARIRMPVPDVAPYIWAPAAHPLDLIEGEDDGDAQGETAGAEAP